MEGDLFIIMFVSLWHAGMILVALLIAVRVCSLVYYYATNKPINEWEGSTIVFLNSDKYTYNPFSNHPFGMLVDLLIYSFCVLFYSVGWWLFIPMTVVWFAAWLVRRKYIAREG